MARQIGIDLGSANTLIYLKDNGIILSSPTVIALDKNTGKDLCYGSQAKKMLGKTPKYIRVSKPVREGVIADMDDTTLLITRLLEKTELISFFSRPDAYVCVPTKCTEVERRAVQTAIYEAGTRNVSLVQEPLAAAVGAGLKVLSAKGRMIVDIGEGTTEVAVISLGDIVVSRSQKIAGSNLDSAIMNYLYNERRIEVGELTAELVLKVGDDITTDHIMPAGTKVLPYRSNVPKLSEFCFTVCDPTFPERAKTLGGGVIMGGVNYGQGSSREHAALVPLYLGIKAVVAKSFARIHVANLINFGIVPMTLENPEDYDLFAQGDEIEIVGFADAVKGADGAVLKNVSTGKQAKLKLSLSPRQREILLAGGRLNYTKR